MLLVLILRNIRLTQGHRNFLLGAFLFSEGFGLSVTTEVTRLWTPRGRRLSFAPGASGRGGGAGRWVTRVLLWSGCWGPLLVGGRRTGPEGLGSRCGMGMGNPCPGSGVATGRLVTEQLPIHQAGL